MPNRRSYRLNCHPTEIRPSRATESACAFRPHFVFVYDLLRHQKRPSFAIFAFDPSSQQVQPRCPAPP